MTDKAEQVAREIGWDSTAQRLYRAEECERIAAAFLDACEIADAPDQDDVEQAAHHLREHATALRSFPGWRTDVKPLEWPATCRLGRRVHTDGSNLATYTIAHYGSIYRWASDMGSWSDPLATYDEAKAAAQADFESRIRSALVTPPDLPHEGK